MQFREITGSDQGVVLIIKNYTNCLLMGQEILYIMLGTNKLSAFVANKLLRIS